MTEVHVSGITQQLSAGPPPTYPSRLSMFVIFQTSPKRLSTDEVLFCLQVDIPDLFLIASHQQQVNRLHTGLLMLIKYQWLGRQLHCRVRVESHYVPRCVHKVVGLCWSYIWLSGSIVMYSQGLYSNYTTSLSIKSSFLLVKSLKQSENS